MNKILKIAIVAVLCLILILTITLFACQNDNGDKTGTTTTKPSTTTTTTTGNNPPECTEHVDANTDYVCDDCGKDLEKPADPDEFTSVNDTVYVVASGELNLRTSPEILEDNTATFTAKTNDVLTRTGYTADWSRVVIDGDTYYVSNKYVVVGKPITEFTECDDDVYYMGPYGTISLRHKPTFTTKGDYSYVVTSITQGASLKRTGIAKEADVSVDDEGEAYSIVWARVEITVDGKTQTAYINNKYLSVPFESKNDTVKISTDDGYTLRSYPVYFDTEAGEKDDSYHSAADKGETFKRLAVATVADEDGITWSVIQDSEGNVFFISTNLEYIEIIP